MAERCVANKDSHGHKYNTMDLLNSSERAQDQSSAMVRTASSCFAMASPGPRSCSPGGGVSPSPAKNSEEKLVDLKMA